MRTLCTRLFGSKLSRACAHEFSVYRGLHSFVTRGSHENVVLQLLDSLSCVSRPSVAEGRWKLTLAPRVRHKLDTCPWGAISPFRRVVPERVPDEACCSLQLRFWGASYFNYAGTFPNANLEPEVISKATSIM